MPTWKNPFVIAFASAGIIVSSAFPPLSHGQTSENSPSLTTEYNYHEQGELGSRNEGNITSFQQQDEPQQTEPEISTFGDEHLQFGEPSGLITEEVAPTKSDSSTVVVRPTAKAAIELSDLIVNVDTIEGSNPREFAVKLMVPDSVKIVEVTPINSPTQARKLQINLEQPSSQAGFQGQQNAAAGSNYSMPIAAPIHSASSTNSVIPQMQQNPAPLKQRSPSQFGFRKNPFYKPASDRKPLALTPGNTSQVTNVNGLKPIPGSIVDNSHPRQASYDAISDSTQLQALIQSSLQGPKKMELGAIGDFTVDLNNPTGTTITNVTVGLDVAQGFEVVLLDRAAEFDKNAGTLTWKIAELPPSETHTIRYRVRSLVEGTQLQRSWLGSVKDPVQVSTIDTVVAIDLESSEAPMLPFESN